MCLCCLVAANQMVHAVAWYVLTLAAELDSAFPPTITEEKKKKKFKVPKWCRPFNW